MTWTLHLDDEIIPARTGNARDGRWGRHKHAKQVREAVGWAAKAVTDPKPRRPLVDILVTRRVTDERRRDPDNLAAAVKPALDGIVDAGIIPDDSSAVVQSITYQIVHDGEVYRPGWTIELEDA